MDEGLYCEEVLKRFGKQAHGWLQEKYKTLNAKTQIIVVHERDLFNDAYHWFRPPMGRTIDFTADPPTPRVISEPPVRVTFDRWAFAKNGKAVGDFYTGYVPEENTLFILE